MYVHIYVYKKNINKFSMSEYIHKTLLHRFNTLKKEEKFFLRLLNTTTHIL